MSSSMQAIFDKRKQAGFTVTELIVAIVVMAILSVPTFTVMGDLYTDAMGYLGKTVQVADTRSALRAIDRDLINSIGFLGSYEVNSPMGVGDTGTDWEYSGIGNHRRTLIVQTYATDKDPSDPTRLPVFMRPTAGTCSDPSDIAVVTRIYYVARDTSTPVGSPDKYNLYRRTLLPSTSSGDYCGADGTSGVMPYQKHSCMSSGCAGRDALLLQDITEFDVDYYALDSSDLLVGTDDIGQAAEVRTARNAVVTIRTDRSIQGKNVISKANITVRTDVKVTLGNEGGLLNEDPSIDPATGAPCNNSQEYSTAGSHTYTIPSCARFIAVVLMGGGGGGQGGSSLIARSGNGGHGGQWAYATLQLGADIDSLVEQLRITVGSGGSGGAGYGTEAATLLGPQNGSRGGMSQIEQVVPRGGADINYGPLPLTIEWGGLFAMGGGGGHGYGAGSIAGNPSVPMSLTYMGRTYSAGAPGASKDLPGTAPGGAGAGGGRQTSPFTGGRSGATGAPGRVWIRAY